MILTNTSNETLTEHKHGKSQRRTHEFSNKFSHVDVQLILYLDLRNKWNAEST